VSKGLLVPAKGEILLTLRVSPGAKAASIEGLHGERTFKVSPISRGPGRLLIHPR
jgi:uncharacterized protein YggU (UPF0235/DUF167 family)